MALITAKKIKEKEKIKLEIDKDTYSEIKQYCSWVGIDEIDYFFEQAAQLIFVKDKAWKNQQRSAKKIKQNEAI